MNLFDGKFIKSLIFFGAIKHVHLITCLLMIHCNMEMHSLQIRRFMFHLPGNRSDVFLEVFIQQNALEIISNRALLASSCSRQNQHHSKNKISFFFTRRHHTTLGWKLTVRGWRFWMYSPPTRGRTGASFQPADTPRFTYTWPNFTLQVGFHSVLCLVNKHTYRLN